MRELSHYRNPVSIPQNIRETASEDGAVLLDVNLGMCFSLNSIGLKIWSLLKQGNNIEQVADVLQNDYAVARSQLLDDICSFMHELEVRKLLLAEDRLRAPVKKSGLFSRVWRRRKSA